MPPPDKAGVAPVARTRIPRAMILRMLRFMFSLLLVDEWIDESLSLQGSPRELEQAPDLRPILELKESGS
jgi:hypothetical protein